MTEGNEAEKAWRETTPSHHRQFDGCDLAKGSYIMVTRRYQEISHLPPRGPPSARRTTVFFHKRQRTGSEVWTSDPLRLALGLTKEE